MKPHFFWDLWLWAELSPVDHGASVGNVQLLQPSLAWGRVGIYWDSAKGVLALLLGSCICWGFLGTQNCQISLNGCKSDTHCMYRKPDQLWTQGLTGCLGHLTHCHRQNHVTGQHTYFTGCKHSTSNPQPVPARARPVNFSGIARGEP